MDEQISGMEGLEVIPGYKITSSFTADLEALANWRGTCNMGTYPFVDCLHSQSERNLPKHKREACKERTVEFCQTMHRRFLKEAKGNKSKVSEFYNCLHEPLFPKSLSNKNLNLPINHILTGIGFKNVTKAEEEMLDFDKGDAVFYLDPSNKEGAFWTFIRFRLFSFQKKYFSKNGSLYL